MTVLRRQSAVVLAGLSAAVVLLVCLLPHAGNRGAKASANPEGLQVPHGLSFEKDYCDIGRLFDNESFDVAFAFTNGLTPRQIVAVQPNCLCTDVRVMVDSDVLVVTGRGHDTRFEPAGAVVKDEFVSALDLASGARGSVRLRGRLFGKRGRLRISADVWHRDVEGLQRKTLVADCVVLPLYVVEPAEVVLKALRWTDVTSFSCLVIPQGNRRDDEIRCAEELPPGVACRVERDVHANSSVWRIEGSIDVARTRQSFILKLLTTWGNSIEIPVVLEVVNPVRVKPARIVSLGRFAASEGVQRQVSVATTDGTALSMKGIRLHSAGRGGGQVRVEPSTRPRDRSEIVINLEVRPGAPNGIVRATLEIETDHPFADRIEVGVFGISR